MKKKIKSFAGTYSAIGMCLGISLGLAVSVGVGIEMHIGLIAGLVIGMVAGNAIGAAKDSAVEEQLKEKGYSVKAVEPAEDGSGYTVTVGSIEGEELQLTVSNEQMQEDGFSVGDPVYVDEDGEIEQLREDEDE